MRVLFAVLLAISSVVLSVAPASAEKRVALVVGNAAYQHANRLTNPVNDSGAMSAMFKNAGFDVVELRQNLGVREMRKTLRDFADSVRGADIAIVYFAGHGIEIDGTNYVIPVDAVMERDIDAFDEAIPLDRILTVIEPARQLRLVILDACRDNPFNKTMKRTIAARAVGRGLAKVEPSSPNTLVAFAAKAGSTASDGDTDNSPFTAALVKYLTRPGLDVRKAFGFARDEVLKVTGNRQEPFIYGSLGGDDVALVPEAKAPSTAPIDPNNAARRDYELAERIGTIPVWDSFISNYPSGFYTDLAKAQRGKLVAAAESTAAAEKATAAEQRAGQPAGPVAALPPDQAAKPDKPAAADLPRLLQSELRRVGCYSGPVDGMWTAMSQKSLGLFNKSARTKFDVGLASLDALDSVRTRTGRVCPLICERGYKADGDSCTKITCKSGYQLGDNNTCERIEKRPAQPATTTAPDRERPARPASVSSFNSGRTACSIYCKQKYGGAMPREESRCLAFAGNCDHSR